MAELRVKIEGTKVTMSRGYRMPADFMSYMPADIKQFIVARASEWAQKVMTHRLFAVDVEYMVNVNVENMYSHALQAEYNEKYGEGAFETWADEPLGETTPSGDTPDTVGQLSVYFNATLPSARATINVYAESVSQAIDTATRMMNTEEFTIIAVNQVTPKKSR